MSAQTGSGLSPQPLAREGARNPILAGLTMRWAALDAGGRQRTMLAGLAFLLVAGGLLWWSSKPSWRTLYSALSPEEARSIGTVLTAANLTYDVSPDGTTLRVPVDELDKARMSTAGKAGGKSGRIGYELFDKPDWAGSDFDEKVNYQRALEGELEHTIDTLESVQSSRVHLVLAHDSLFSEAERDAKASVVLRLKTRQLTDEQAESIKSLVASSVDDLSADHVVLLDADGHGLLGRNGGSDRKAAYEQTLAERVLDTLEPVVGQGNVRATVNVDYDTASRDEVSEAYDPSSVVTLSMQKSEATSGGQAAPQGVPGTASNAPNQQAPLLPPAKPGTESSKQESGNYGASKKTAHLVEGPGRITRITAAVLVNDRLVPGPDKKKTPQQQPWTADQLKEIVSLAQASIGFEESRGDKVVVENLRFDLPAEHGPSTLDKLMRQRGWAEPVVKDGLIGVLILITLLMVIRPAIAVLGKAAPAPVHIQSATRLEPGGAAGPATGAKVLDTSAQAAFDQVVDTIQKDPAQSAKILQTWIRAE